MILKSNENSYPLTNFYLSTNCLNQNSITLYGTLEKELLEIIQKNGFCIYADEEAEESLFEGKNFTLLYDEAAGMACFMEPNSVVYYDYLVIDEDGYAISSLPTGTPLEGNNLFLYSSGQKRKNREFVIDLFNEQNEPIYILRSNTIEQTTEEEKKYYIQKKENKEKAEARALKLAELSDTCEKVIYAGTDVELSIGVHHFAFTTNDQNNIKTLFDLAITAKPEYLPYHADGELCQMYTAADIIQLYIKEQEFILYHNTYFNTLKSYVNTLLTIDEINSVQYGQALEGSYKEQLDSIVTASASVLASVQSIL